MHVMSSLLFIWKFTHSMARTDWEILKVYFHILTGKHILFSFSLTISLHNRKNKLTIPKKKDKTHLLSRYTRIYMTDSSSWFQQEFSWTLNISVIQILLGVAENPAEPGTKCEQLYINLNCYSINRLGNSSQIEQQESWRGIFLSPALLKGQISVQIRRFKH